MAFTVHAVMPGVWHIVDCMGVCMTCLLYTSDAADEL